MPKTISEEKRKDVIFHKKNGKDSAVVADFLRITVRSVNKIWRQFRMTGSVQNKICNCGRKSAITPDQKFKILAKIKKTPDVTLSELIEKFDLDITESGLSKWLKKYDFSFKKRQLTQQNKIEQMSKKKGKIGEKRLKILIRQD